MLFNLEIFFIILLHKKYWIYVNHNIQNCNECMERINVFFLTKSNLNKKSVFIS